MDLELGFGVSAVITLLSRMYYNSFASRGGLYTPNTDLSSVSFVIFMCTCTLGGGTLSLVKEHVTTPIQFPYSTGHYKIDEISGAVPLRFR